MQLHAFVRHALSREVSKTNLRQFSPKDASPPLGRVASFGSAYLFERKLVSKYDLTEDSVATQSWINLTRFIDLTRPHPRIPDPETRPTLNAKHPVPGPINGTDHR